MKKKTLLEQAIKVFTEEALNFAKVKKLRVFDFDDTLAVTKSKVRLITGSGEQKWLTPAEYAVYNPKPGDEFDYSQFDHLIEPTEIKWITKILRSVTAKRGTNAAMILTARRARNPIKAFLKTFNLPEIPIVALGESDPEAKAQWIVYMAKKFSYTHIEVFDDSEKNIAAIQAKQPELPQTKIITRLIRHHHNISK